VLKSFIGQGYHGTHTPGVILRNILENPAWYTAYTPYQAEISQGRMEALVNFQTMVCDLTGMAIANASMLDEATAAAEAMTLAKRSVKSKSNTFVVAGDCHPQTIEVIQTRAAPLGMQVVLANSAAEWDSLIAGGDYFAVLVQCPPPTAADPRPARRCRRASTPHQAAFIVAADLLALTLLTPPGEYGRRHRGGQHPALRRAHGRRRPARGLPGLPRRVQAQHARPPGGREHRRARRPPTGWRCRRANSTSAARRPPATSAPPRCCWR
jgi:glycine dehydrogenase